MIKFTTWKQNWSRDIETKHELDKPKSQRTMDKRELAERTIQAAGRAINNLCFGYGAFLAIVAVPLLSPNFLITGLFIMAMSHEGYAISSRITANYIDCTRVFLEVLGWVQPLPPNAPATGAQSLLGRLVQNISNGVNAVAHVVTEASKAAAKEAAIQGFTNMTKDLFEDTLFKEAWQATARFAIRTFVKLYVEQQGAVDNT